MNPMNQTASGRVAAFVSGLSAEAVPADVREKAALHVLDTWGVGLAAAALGEGRFIIDAFAQEAADGPAAAIGVARPLAAADAALINGTLCHTLDFDDTHPDSVVHVSAAIVPAATAAVQKVGGSAADLVRAVVVGTEISTRVGAAAGGRFHARGFHPTGVCGVFGATAAVAAALRLETQTVMNALGIAGSMSAGLLEFLADGSDTKRVHAGWAAQAGVRAVQLAVAGATGPRTVFEGDRGFFATYLHGESHDLDGQLATLGETWETSALAIKPYPACHYTHAPVDALLAVLDREQLEAGDIASITAYSDETGAHLVLIPAEDKLRPRTAYDAKFSLPYCLAHVLRHRRLDITAFTDEAVADEAVLALTSLVDYEVKEYSPSPDAFGGGVRVRTRDGRELTEELRHQRGGRENPLTSDEIAAKFRANAALALADRDVARLEALATGLAGGTADLGALQVLAGARLG